MVSVPRKRVDARAVVNQFGQIAGRLEKASADVSAASGRAKQTTKAVT
jgi:hypothetical protein